MTDDIEGQTSQAFQKSSKAEDIERQMDALKRQQSEKPINLQAIQGDRDVEKHRDWARQAKNVQVASGAIGGYNLAYNHQEAMARVSAMDIAFKIGGQREMAWPFFLERAKEVLAWIKQEGENKL